MVLFVLLNKRTRNPESLNVFLFFLKMSAASCVVGLACYKLTNYLENFIPWQRLGGAVLLLTIVSTAGLLLLACVGVGDARAEQRQGRQAAGGDYRDGPHGRVVPLLATAIMGAG